ncbi:hypothetical protein Bca52824_083359 [Brassica carinata]|uniref:Uncharacterized protein n=1 Tax=Brassica carinata TaxID=52824 RepID=A0A8X7PM72_BRACI|nr:hypothetical protein Bca52824_083359 [Brassica carinata]
MNVAQNKAWRSTLSVLDDVSFKVIQDKDCGGHIHPRATNYRRWVQIEHTSFFVLGFSPDFNAYGAIFVDLGFSVVFANVIIICNTTIVISILEDVSGPRAFVRANDLIKGQTQVGLLIFLGSTIGLTFVVGLFEHRLKILSYGDGASRGLELDTTRAMMDQRQRNERSGESVARATGEKSDLKP